ncbi:MAG: cysteine--tRNA ligase [Acidimicrobiales bacterium]
MLALYDTALRRVEELDLRRPGEVSLYVCGPTVYGEPHAGHGRMTVVWDVLRRYLEWSGLAVRMVSNITDIDDKIIERANREGRTAAEVAEQYEARWYDVMDGLGVRRPDADPHATAWVGEMVALVAGLVADGAAYPTADGVYFSAARVADYGLLAGQALDDMRAGERVAVVEEKRAPADFALWKKAKPGEPRWPSPWGDGRPGWHTECVVMSLGLLGEGFDIHGGGIDLVFPHHENERAQAVAAGRAFARRWAHSGHLVATGGEKMSKSLGNVVSLGELLDGFDARAFRLVVLQAHYRSPMEVSREAMASAQRAVARFDELNRKLERLGATAEVTPNPEVLSRFRALMDDDLGTPAATGLIFETVTAANAALVGDDRPAALARAAAVFEMLKALGMATGRHGPDVPAGVAALVQEREAARASGDWGRADEIRHELGSAGWVVKDTPGGSQVHFDRPGAQ